MALLLSLETKLGSIPLILCEIMGTVQFPETILDKEQGLWWSAVTPNVTGLTNCFKSTFLFTRSARDARWGQDTAKVPECARLGWVVDVLVLVQAAASLS